SSSQFVSLYAAVINLSVTDKLLGVVHNLPTDLTRTRQCLNGAGFREVQEQDVVVVPVTDEPGSAAQIFQRIADAHINVRYSYLATNNRLVIAATNPQAVIDAVKG